MSSDKENQVSRDAFAATRTLPDLLAASHEPLVDGDSFPQLEELEDLKILERVGAGGMGIVYRALQRSLDREVAVKLLTPGRRLRNELYERFHSEALLAASLNHPNIAHIHWVRRQDELFYFVMEFIEGLSLSQRIVHQRLPLGQLIELFCQVCNGLSHAHERGVVHRDLKPGNILISENTPSQPRAVIVDFGLAVRAGEPAVSPSGILMGTPAYVSPEQAQGNATDHRTDIYSLGITLFEAVTGRIPFAAPTPLAMALKHVQEPPPDPRDLAPDLPDALADLIHQMIAKSPEDRPQSASELENRLRQMSLSGRSNRSPMPLRVGGLEKKQMCVLALDLTGYPASAYDQPVARTEFELESWSRLVESHVERFAGAVSRRDASRIIAVFDPGLDDIARAVDALVELQGAVLLFNRTNGTALSFTAGMEVGEVFVGQLANAELPTLFGDALTHATALSAIKHCGLGLTGEGLEELLKHRYSLESLIGVADQLGQAFRLDPALFTQPP
ncbi:MAG: protein kinase [Myxococcales bacterium]|nr:protein kinase [Myxococcales bacterium]